MEGLRSSLDELAETSVLLRPSVPAEVLYTLLGLTILPVVVLGSFVARSVVVLSRDLGSEGLPVAPAVNVCSCCKEDRAKTGKPPRSLMRLPIEVTQSKEFASKGKPFIKLCEFCDGDALEEALKEHKRRTSKP